MATATSKKTTLKPLDDRIVLRPHEPKEKTESGIYLPEAAKEKPMTASVVSVGPGKLNDKGERTPCSVKEGDDVLYGKYAGTEVEIDDEKLVIVRESELLGVVEG
jgi:chaperonin GroES